MDIKRVSTGIAALDELLHGGFVKGRSYLVAGDAGTGKTTACMQFLLSGLKQGEKAVYVTVDERPAEIIESAASLSWDFQSHIQDKSLVILDAAPYFGGRAGMATDKGVDLQKIISDLSGYAKRMDATRLAIDPVTPLILPMDSTSRVQDQARTFIHFIQSQLSTTNLFTAHFPARSTQDQTFGIEEFLASGVFVLGTTPVDDRFARTLTLKKMRGTPCGPGEYRFSIEHVQGIVLDGETTQPTSSGPAAHPTLELFELPKAGK
jgi:circadian clock protein KaiC